MQCRLCDRHTEGAVKLCADCTKALMRARAASAALHKLPKSLANRVETTADTQARLPATAWRRIAWAAAGLAAIGTFYVGMPEPDRRHASAALVASRSSTPLAEEPRGDAASIGTILEQPTSTSELKVAKTSASDVPAMASSTVKSGTRANTTLTNANRDSRPSSAANTPANDRAMNKSKTPARSESESSQLLARAGDAPAASPPDVGQLPASAPEKCGNENPLARFICEQKAYLQYCEGRWGNDPRCLRRTGSN